MRPEKGFIIKELNHLAGSHVKGSTMPQREGREEREGKGESSVAEIKAGTSAAEWDPVTNRQPNVSLPKTVHMSSAGNTISHQISCHKPGGSWGRRGVGRTALSRRQTS